jgi:hypothetical protein
LRNGFALGSIASGIRQADVVPVEKLRSCVELRLFALPGRPTQGYLLPILLTATWPVVAAFFLPPFLPDTTLPRK